MKGKAELLILIIVGVALLAFFLFGYLFNIYEADIRVSSKKLYADGSSESLIAIIPLNSFGNQTPFRVVGGTFEILEGNHLVEIVARDVEKGILIVRARSTPGKVVIKVTPRMAILPSEVVILIYPNAV